MIDRRRRRPYFQRHHRRSDFWKPLLVVLAATAITNGAQWLYQGATIDYYVALTQKCFR